MTNTDLLRWLMHNTHEYLGTVTINAGIIHNLISRINTLEELRNSDRDRLNDLRTQVGKEKSATTSDGCQYFFKIANQYCTARGPHDTHTTEPQAKTAIGQWRVGSKVGRTIYLDNKLVGLVDTIELATQIVNTMNGANHLWK